MTPAKPLKSETVQLRLTKEEKEKLEALAERNKMSVSAWLRWVIHTTRLK